MLLTPVTPAVVFIIVPTTKVLEPATATAFVLVVLLDSTRERRELALARRHVVQEKRLTEHTKTLPKLKVSDVVMIQNQSGPHPLKVNTASALQDQRITEFANQNVEDVISETLVPSAQVINISKLNLILIKFLSL